MITFILTFRDADEIEIMHEHRAMTITYLKHDYFDALFINGVNFESLLDEKFKDAHKDKFIAFTETDRRHEDFSKFFKRYCSKEEQ